MVHRARGSHRGMPQISFHFQVCISTDVQTPVFINIRVRRYIVRRCVYNVHCTSSFHFDFELLREFSDGTTGLGWKGSICTKRFKSRSKLNSLKKKLSIPNQPNIVFISGKWRPETVALSHFSTTTKPEVLQRRLGHLLMR